MKRRVLSIALAVLLVFATLFTVPKTAATSEAKSSLYFLIGGKTITQTELDNAKKNGTAITGSNWKVEVSSDKVKIKLDNYVGGQIIYDVLTSNYSTDVVEVYVTGNCTINYTSNSGQYNGGIMIIDRYGIPNVTVNLSDDAVLNVKNGIYVINDEGKVSTDAVLFIYGKGEVNIDSDAYGIYCAGTKSTTANSPACLRILNSVKVYIKTSGATASYGVFTGRENGASNMTVSGLASLIVEASGQAKTITNDTLTLAAGYSIVQQDQFLQIMMGESTKYTISANNMSNGEVKASVKTNEVFTCDTTVFTISMPKWYNNQTNRYDTTVSPNTSYTVVLTLIPGKKCAFIPNMQFMLPNGVKQKSFVKVEGNSSNYLLTLYVNSYCPHDYEVIASSSSCTSKGTETKKCKICGNLWVSVLPIQQHSIDDYLYCDENSHFYMCKTCGKQFKYRARYPEEGTVEHTMVKYGSNAEQCSVCGYITGCETDYDQWDDVGHWFPCVSHSTEACPNHGILEYGLHEPMYKTVGTEKILLYDCQSGYRCKICCSPYGKLGMHDYKVDQSKTVEPTCVKSGKKYYYCAYNGQTDTGGGIVECNATYEEIIPATGHSFINYTSNGDATCEANGTMTAKCSVCTATETIIEPDSKKSHISAGPATETSPEVCLTCGRMISPATGSYNNTPVFVSYHTHIQSLGDTQGVKSNGDMAGTSGKSYRLENIWLRVDSSSDVGIQYTTHCQSYGWLPWSANGEINGTSGEAKRLEAIKIQLTGSDKNLYNVYYRVQVQGFGWLAWTKNGAPAGTAGYAYRLEAIQVIVLPKEEGAPGLDFGDVKASTQVHNSQSYIAKTAGSITIPGNETLPNVSYRTHVQSYGWQKFVMNGAMSGTSGQAKRLEGIEIKLSNKLYSGGIAYTTHVQSYGWQGNVNDVSTWKKDGEMSGTSGEAKRLEAICITLTGEMAGHYDVYYRVHAQSYGWLGWAKNGQASGTAGGAKRLEAIQIVLVPKGGTAPAADYGGIKSALTQTFVQVK